MRISSSLSIVYPFLKVLCSVNTDTTGYHSVGCLSRMVVIILPPHHYIYPHPPVGVPGLSGGCGVLLVGHVVFECLECFVDVGGESLCF
jgi:hypothetical protein